MLFSRYFACIGVATITMGLMVEVAASDHHDMNLPPCNTVINIMTVDQIRAMAASTIGDLLGDENQDQLDDALMTYTGTTKYDVLVSKVCGSCADYYDRLVGQQSDGEDNDAWMEHCGPDVYGYNATHSALVLHPIDPMTNAPLNGVRNVIFQYKGATGFSLEDAFSTSFPTINITEALSSALNQTSGDFFASINLPEVLLVGASSGLIAIGPDYMGTGESAAMLDRAFNTAQSVQQTTVVAYLAAYDYTVAATNGCTQMSDTAAVFGFSLGGAAAIWGSLALSTIGVSIERCFSGSGVYSNVLIAQGIFGNILASPNDTAPILLRAYVAAFASAFSHEAPYMLNTGTGQTLLNPNLIMAAANDTNAVEFDVLRWVYEDKLSIEALSALMPSNHADISQLLNPAIFGPIASAGATGNMCGPDHITANIGNLCATLNDQSTLSVATDIDFVTETCHSPSDELIPIVLTQLLLGSGNPNIVTYEPLFDFLQPTGSHAAGYRYCRLAVPTFLASEVGSTFGQAVSPIESESNDIGSGAMCPGIGMETAMPTDTPTSSPATTSAAMTYHFIPIVHLVHAFMVATIFGLSL